MFFCFCVTGGRKVRLSALLGLKKTISWRSTKSARVPVHLVVMGNVTARGGDRASAYPALFRRRSLFTAGVDSRHMLPAEKDCQVRIAAQLLKAGEARHCRLKFVSPEDRLLACGLTATTIAPAIAPFRVVGPTPVAAAARSAPVPDLPVHADATAAALTAVVLDPRVHANVWAAALSAVVLPPPVGTKTFTATLFAVVLDPPVCADGAAATLPAVALAPPVCAESTATTLLTLSLDPPV